MRFFVITMIVGYFLLFALVVKSPHKVAAQPSFNGDSPGCTGNGCHSLKSGVITAQYVGKNTIRITLAGATGKVGGEVVDPNGVVIVTNNSSSSNPFDLTVSQPGVYKINGGYKNPKREWDSTTVRVTAPTTVDEQTGGVLPNDFYLEQNYPNPFFAGSGAGAATMNATTIRYSLPAPSEVSVAVYDLSGREIRRLVTGSQPTGVHETIWDGRNAGGNRVAAGTYFFRMTAGSFTAVRRLLLLE